MPAIGNPGPSTATAAVPGSRRKAARRTSVTAAATAYPAARYGVIDRRQGDRRASKCTLCYGLEQACAKACPTKSIQFGPLDELRERAASDWTSCTWWIL